jgi:two-component system sensor kinase FixL
MKGEGEGSSERGEDCRLSLAAQASATMLVDWDVKAGRVLSFGDPQVLATLGVPGEAGTEQWSHRLHPAERMAVIRRLCSSLEGKEERWTDEYRLRRPDGSWAWLSLRTIIVRDPAGGAERVVGTACDVTERKHAEEERQRLGSDLIRMSQIHAMTAAATTLAHELNQPLTAAANYLAIARTILADLGGNLAREAEQDLSDAEGQITRAGDIIRRIRLLTSRHDSTAQREASLADAVRGVAALLSSVGACERARIRFEPGAGADRVKADPVQLEQVLFNLIRNACEAMPDEAEPEVLVSSRDVAGGFTEITIADSGTGFDGSLLPELLDSVGTSTAGSHGLGLPISRAIVEALGGRFWAHNNARAGASLFFTLPTAETDRANRPAIAAGDIGANFR